MANATRTIVFFSRYLPSMGGIENFTHSLAIKLNQQGNKVIVVTTDGEPGIFREKGIDVFRLKKLSLLNGRYPIPFSMGLRKKLISMIGDASDISIVINGRYYILSNIGAHIANSMGITPILIDHSSSFITIKPAILSLPLKAAEIYTTKALMRYKIAFYGVSKMSSKWLSSFGIESHGEITNAIDADAFEAQASDRVFLEKNHRLVITYAGRLIEEKGVLEVADLAAKFPDSIDVMVAGSGPLCNLISNLAEKYDNLHYFGRLNHPDLAALLKQTDVFCFPSKYPEGLPTCLLEAAACKCALITTVNGGTEEIIPDPSCGFILTSSDPVELDTLISHLIEEPGICDNCGINISRHVRLSFSWDQAASRLIEACEKAD